MKVPFSLAHFNAALTGDTLPTFLGAWAKAANELSNECKNYSLKFDLLARSLKEISDHAMIIVTLTKATTVQFASTCIYYIETTG